MNPQIRRVIGEGIEEVLPRSVEGFVAVQPDGQLYTGAAAHTILFGESAGILQRFLPPGHATLVPATLVLHPDHAKPV